MVDRFKGEITIKMVLKPSIFGKAINEVVKELRLNKIKIYLNFLCKLKEVTDA